MLKRNRDPSRWCEFYQDNGHTTNECIDLKDQLEEMVRKGHFSRYLRDKQSLYRDRRMDSKHDPGQGARRQDDMNGGDWRNERSGYQGKDRRTPVINVINGGPVYGGTIRGVRASMRGMGEIVNQVEVGGEARRRMPVYTFSAEDCKGIVYPHDDPFVVEVKISNYLVEKVLIDGGSSTNILSEAVFGKMHISASHLKAVNYQVSGFTETSVYPLGRITFPVRIGKEEKKRDVMEEFLIVDISEAYNVILGRSLIHNVEGVASSFHLCLAYVSNEGRSEGQTISSQIILCHGSKKQ